MKHFNECPTPGAGPTDPMASLELEVFDTPPAAVLDDDWWPDDADAVAEWRARRPRRIAVKLVGWALLGLAGWGTLQIAEEPKALDAMAAWATLGHVKNGSDDPATQSAGFVAR